MFVLSLADVPNLKPFFTSSFRTTLVSLSRVLNYLGGRLKSLKLFKTQHSVAV
jgi:hypothetical protein